MTGIASARSLFGRLRRADELIISRRCVRRASRMLYYLHPVAPSPMMASGRVWTSSRRCHQGASFREARCFRGWDASLPHVRLLLQVLL